MRRAGGLWALTACVLSGCIATPPMRQIAVDTNRVVADSANDQLMLNLLRAKDRLPMHFTSFTVLRGNLSLGGTAGLDVSLPEGGRTITYDTAGLVTDTVVARGVNTVTPKLGATITANPSFDLAVYDTKQFQAGFLAPVDPSVIEYYLQSGWPDDLLTALFVSRVDITLTEGGVPTRKSFVNEPDQAGNFGRFIALTEMVPSKEEGKSTPLIRVSQFTQGLALADIEKLDGKKYDVKDGFVIRKTASSRGVSFSDWELAAPLLFPGKIDGGLRCVDSALFTMSEDKGRASATCTWGPDGAGKPNLSIEVFFRSPEAILYFLGAYARCDLKEESETCTPYAMDNKAKVITVKRGEVDGALFSVRHRGAMFSIPEPDYVAGAPDHRGSQALVLVQQLINLQKSADTLPATSSIQLIQ